MLVDDIIDTTKGGNRILQIRFSLFIDAKASFETTNLSAFKLFRITQTGFYEMISPRSEKPLEENPEIPEHNPEILERIYEYKKRKKISLILHGGEGELVCCRFKISQPSIAQQLFKITFPHRFQIASIEEYKEKNCIIVLQETPVVHGSVEQSFIIHIIRIKVTKEKRKHVFLGQYRYDYHRIFLSMFLLPKTEILLCRLTNKECFVVDLSDDVIGNEDIGLYNLGLSTSQFSNFYCVFHSPNDLQEFMIISRFPIFRDDPLEIIEFWSYDKLNRCFSFEKKFKSSMYFTPTSILCTEKTLFVMNGRSRWLDLVSIQKGESVNFIDLPRPKKDKNAQHFHEMIWGYGKDGLVMITNRHVHVMLIVNRKRLKKRFKGYLIKDEIERIQFLIESEFLLSKKIQFLNGNSINFEYSILV